MEYTGIKLTIQKDFMQCYIFEDIYYNSYKEFEIKLEKILKRVKRAKWDIVNIEYIEEWNND